MSLRFACVLAFSLVTAPAFAQEVSQPVWGESNFYCQPYFTCSSPSQCEQPGINHCEEVATGDLVCVPSPVTRFNLICCGDSSDCVDEDGLPGTCMTFQQPVGDDFSVCLWGSPRNFGFCKDNPTGVTYDDIAACAGEAPSSFSTLAEKLLVGDCDGDTVLNRDDLCPCEYANQTANGCPVVVDDGGVTLDASTPDDGSVTSDASTRPDSGSTALQSFGGGGGCEGCAAGEGSASNALPALLVLATLLMRRRAA